MNRDFDACLVSWRSAGVGCVLFAAVFLPGVPAATKAEQIVCPQASPLQTFRLGYVTWNHEYSTLLLRRVQIGPVANGTRIFCEKLHGAVSAEVGRPCALLAGAGRIEAEAETGISSCTMPPHANHGTNIEDCRIVCGSELLSSDRRTP